MRNTTNTPLKNENFSSLNNEQPVTTTVASNFLFLYHSY